MSTGYFCSYCDRSYHEVYHHCPQRKIVPERGDLIWERERNGKKEVIFMGKLTEEQIHKAEKENNKTYETKDGIKWPIDNSNTNYEEFKNGLKTNTLPGFNAKQYNIGMSKAMDDIFWDHNI